MAAAKSRKANGRITRPEWDGEVQNVGCEFVALAGSALFRQQARQTIPLKILFRSAHRLFAHSDAAKHLVLDLDEVVGIEEIADSEEWIYHNARMRIESAVALPGHRAWIFSPGRRASVEPPKSRVRTVNTIM